MKKISKLVLSAALCVAMASPLCAATITLNYNSSGTVIGMNVIRGGANILLSVYDKSANRTVIGQPTLRSGSQGNSVKFVQTFLYSEGYYRELGVKELAKAVDGKYGPNTVQAVKKFQKAQGITADGVVGPNTWNRIY